MPLGLSPALAAWLALALFAAAWVRGYSGFGSAAVFLAAASLVADPRPLIPAMFLSDLAMTAVLLRGVLGDVDWRRAGIILGGALAGILVSVRLLSQLAPEAARGAVSAVILVLAVPLLAGWRRARPLSAGGLVGTGLASGLANGAGVGGLPVAALMAAEPLAPAAFRATMIAYLTGLDLISLPVLGAAGYLSRQTLLIALCGLPILVAGIRLGSRRFSRAPPETFRRFAALLLLLLSALGLARALF
jgi:uncharacterized protein